MLMYVAFSLLVKNQVLLQKILYSLSICTEMVLVLYIALTIILAMFSIVHVHFTTT